MNFADPLVICGREATERGVRLDRSLRRFGLVVSRFELGRFTMT